MSEREPITAELRVALDVDREFMRADGTVVAQTFCVDRGDFERLCDAIDAVHAQLERENAELRQRVAELDKRGESMHDGGRITDELREYASTRITPNKGQLEAIADRIDAEHKAKVAYWQEASYKDGYDEGFASADDWLAQHEDAMAEHGWVRLPKDADGVTWNIGDRTESGQVVYKLYLDKHGWSFYGLVNDIDPAIHRHHHAPTVEDVLREFADIVRKERVELATISEDTIAEYAKRLTLAGDAE